MRNSIFWAKLLGFYTVILAIGMFVSKGDYENWINIINTQPGVIMALGMFTLLLGLAIVVSHQVWRGWPILVTILGYWITLKGMVLLFFPEWVIQAIAYSKTLDPQYTPVPALVIGLILLVLAFFFGRKYYTD